MIFVNGDLLEKLEKPSDICKWLSSREAREAQ